ncbi:MAG: AMP-binding protein [Betaproteobacteria bacterium]
MRAIDFFDRSADYYPGRCCARDDDSALSYAEVRRRSLLLAASLVNTGLAEEAKVGVLCPNVAASIPVILGVIRSGCSWLPVNARNSGPDNVAILRNNDCEWLLYHSDNESAAEALLAECPGIRGAVCIDRNGTLGPALEEWTAGRDPVPVERGLGRDHVYKLALSGGTTGTPKGVMHTNLNAQVMIASLLLAFPHRSPPVFLCSAPVTHAAGNLCLWVLAAGGTIALMQKADAGAMLAGIEALSVTTLFAPPTVIYNMLAHPDLGKFDYSSLEYFLYGAAPMSAQKLRQAIATFGLKMAQIYSQAEATMALTFLLREDHDVFDDPARLERLRSAGRPGPLVRVRIVDEEGREVTPGQRGELAVQGDLVCKGYYGNQIATSAMMRDGWLMTGDIGYRDADGFVYLVDRKRDLIISGGFNVYPSEVEQVISELSPVLDVTVVGAPDVKWGERVVAVIALKLDAVLSAEQVIEHCKHRLGSVKAPKQVEFRANLPKSPNGKVLKREVRAEFWAGRDSQLTA